MAHHERTVVTDGDPTEINQEIELATYALMRSFAIEAGNLRVAAAVNALASPSDDPNAQQALRGMEHVVTAARYVSRFLQTGETEPIRITDNNFQQSQERGPKKNSPDDPMIEQRTADILAMFGATNERPIADLSDPITAMPRTAVVEYDTGIAGLTLQQTVTRRRPRGIPLFPPYTDTLGSQDTIHFMITRAEPAQQPQIPAQRAGQGRRAPATR